MCYSSHNVPYLRDRVSRAHRREKRDRVLAILAFVGAYLIALFMFMAMK